MEDLSQTLIADLTQAGVDVEQFKHQVAVDQSAIDEVMAMFSGIPEDVVREILLKHDGSVEKSMEELFNRYEQQQQAKLAKAKEAQLEQTTALLQRGFSGIDKSVIEEIVSRHGGDMEEASNELLRVMAEQLERDEQEMLKQKTQQVEQKQAEEKKLRAQIMDHCCTQFDVLTKDEVQEVLRKTDYDLPKAVGELKEKSQARKLRNLTHVFSGVPSDKIRNALEQCDFDLGRAFTLLSAGVKKEVPPTVADEDVLGQSLLHLNPNDQQAKDVLANLLREQAGPGKQEAEAKVAGKAELDAAANGEQPGAGLKVAVSVPQTFYKYGESVQATVNVTGGEGSAYDWVGLFAANEPSNENVLAWSWFKPTVSIALPKYGVFELRCLRKVDGAVLVLGKSEQFTCGPAFKLLTVTPDGEFWKVAWEWDERSEKIGSGAWFGVYNSAEPNSANYLAFQYASAGSVTNSLLFKKRQTNGEYEIRFFAHKFQFMCKSKPLTVEGKDSVEMERVGDQVLLKTRLASADPQVQTKLWVAVCFVNDSRPNKYRRFAYIKQPHESFAFKCPIHTGMYEARIYDHQNRLLAKSEPLNVVGV